MKTKFYICRRCGNLVGMVHDSGVPMICCGEKMEALVPNTVEASGEKHLPVAGRYGWKCASCSCGKCGSSNASGTLY